MSTFEEGTTAGTGNDRWELWKAAWKVFLERPFFGVGQKNFGAFASEFFQPGEVGGMYANNPRMLYNRSLHSFYFTTLSELGIAGISALTWILIDFWRRNAVLRGEAAGRRWKEIGGHMTLRPLALGLEAGMVAFLITAAIYPVESLHWFYTMLALNLTLHRLSKTNSRVLRRSAQPRAVRAPGAAAPIQPIAGRPRMR